MIAFKLPYGKTLEIRPSRELSCDEESEINYADEVEGLVWLLFCGKKKLPWFCTTKKQAIEIAIGVQWGAYRFTEQVNSD